MSLIPQEIIRRKRDGLSLAPQEIAAFIEALSKDGISEGQAAAFAMAVFFRGMNRDEMVALTLAMRDSGDVLSWNDIGRPVADKHSTGGVGDNVSLMLAPIVAACGLAVPMISGRGLGHTGGTLDKLEAIPGYDVMPDEALFRRTVKTVGCAIIGQTGDLAPADKRLYAIRDVTATVDSIPLITASILSKKLAAGLQTLVLDVKVGNGAFMQSVEDARNLAVALVDVANGAGLPTTALITDMNQPLGDAAGNAVEIVNCLDFLAGRKAGTRLEKVVLAFAAEMLVQAGSAATLDEGEVLAEAALSSGRAMEVFAKMVAALGGPADFVDHPSRYLPSAPVILPVSAERSGWNWHPVRRAISAWSLSSLAAAEECRQTRSILRSGSPISCRSAQKWKKANQSPASMRPLSKKRNLPSKGLRPAMGLLTLRWKPALWSSSELPDQPHFATRYLE